ncbi:hypothetical protein D9J24_09860, partial [Escherichia coli]|nr:hypothetical protein [Escherichia coli]
CFFTVVECDLIRNASKNDTLFILNSNGWHIYSKRFQVRCSEFMLIKSIVSVEKCNFEIR